MVSSQWMRLDRIVGAIVASKQNIYSGTKFGWKSRVWNLLEAKSHPGNDAANSQTWSWLFSKRMGLCPISEQRLADTCTSSSITDADASIQSMSLVGNSRLLSFAISCFNLGCRVISDVILAFTISALCPYQSFPGNSVNLRLNNKKMAAEVIIILCPHQTGSFQLLTSMVAEKQ